MGVEPTTASLEGWDSTAELRPPLCSSPLLLHLRPKHLRCLSGSPIYNLPGTSEARFGGQARIRTLEDISQQIYSLPPLATWVPARTTLLFIQKILERFSITSFRDGSLKEE